MLPDANTAGRLRLQALADLVSGLELGLSCDKHTGGMQSKISDSELLEVLKTFNEISQVDLEADFDEDSLQEVTAYVQSVLLTRFKTQN